METRLAPDLAAMRDFVERAWEDDALPVLTRYVAIPNKSPLFDPEWREHGYMDQAVDLVADWCRARPIAGLSLEVVRLPGRTPLVLMEIPPFGPEAPGPDAPGVLLYGHLDKQPEMEGWRDGLGPWTPVRDGDLLYGRGGADDGYAAFASLLAVEAVQRFGGSHGRLMVMIEASEESGSPDLPAYVDHLAERIGDVGLVVCLDSGCGDYERLWGTTSLRGMIAGDLRADVLTEGVHSGNASGVVPSSFRVLRLLLDRVEDPVTGRILPAELHAEIPEQRIAQARETAAILGPIAREFPFADGVRPMEDDPVEQILSRTWRPTLSVTGAGGLPALSDAGNVLRPYTALKLSFRLPPTVPADAAQAVVERLLTEDPPYGARVSFVAEKGATGWNAPPLASWLDESTRRASEAWFGNPAAWMGEGGSIPFMGMLGERFPQAQFLITGVLGPASNAHGPNEFLHVPTAKKLTGCVAQVLTDQVRSVG